MEASGRYARIADGGNSTGDLSYASCRSFRRRWPAIHPDECIERCASRVPQGLSCLRCVGRRMESCRRCTHLPTRDDHRSLGRRMGDGQRRNPTEGTNTRRMAHHCACRSRGQRRDEVDHGSTGAGGRSSHLRRFRWPDGEYDHDREDRDRSETAEDDAQWNVHVAERTEAPVGQTAHRDTDHVHESIGGAP